MLQFLEIQKRNQNKKVLNIIEAFEMAYYYNTHEFKSSPLDILLFGILVDVQKHDNLIYELLEADVFAESYIYITPSK